MTSRLDSWRRRRPPSWFGTFIERLQNDRCDVFVVPPSGSKVPDGETINIALERIHERGASGAVHIVEDVDELSGCLLFNPEPVAGSVGLPGSSPRPIRAEDQAKMKARPAVCCRPLSAAAGG